MTTTTQPRIHSGHVEIAVAHLLNWRRYVIVPNISWGLHLGHECDLLCLSPDNKFLEVEIKISASDLRKDFKKQHGHRSKYIGRLAYAVPSSLQTLAVELVPKSCGIIVVEWKPLAGRYGASWCRTCRHNPCTLQIPRDVLDKYFRLAAMRIWSLKQALLTAKTEIKQFKTTVSKSKS